MGVGKRLGNVNVLVNDGRNQPDCDSKTIQMLCNHYTAAKIRDLVVLRSKKLPKNENGIPVAVSENSDKFVLDILKPQLSKSGIYYLHTPKLDSVEVPQTLKIVEKDGETSFGCGCAPFVGM